MPSIPLRRRAATLAVAGALTVVCVLIPAGAAHAGPAGPAVVAVNSLQQVITGLQNWIIGLLAGLATLFAVIGFTGLATAGSDPSKAERAKMALKSAALGYAGAMLVPVFMAALRGILGV